MKQEFKKPSLRAISVKSQNLMTASATTATTANVYSTAGTGDVMANRTNGNVWND